MSFSTQSVRSGLQLDATSPTPVIVGAVSDTFNELRLILGAIQMRLKFLATKLPRSAAIKLGRLGPESPRRDNFVDRTAGGRFFPTVQIV